MNSMLANIYPLPSPLPEGEGVKVPSPLKERVRER